MNSDIFSSSQVANADIYTDLASLQQIKTLGRENRDEALLQVAQQFESIMVKMMLKGARDANKLFSEDNPFNNSEQQMYQDLMDHQLSLSLSTQRSLGIAEAMVRQLRGDTPAVHSNGSVAKGVRYFAPNVNAIESPATVPPVVASADRAPAPIKTMPKFDGDAKTFVKQLYPLAEKAARKIGVEPEALLAQAALETGWGARIIQHADGGSSNNLFNIKADKRWQGATVSVSTLEYRNGVATKEHAAFRAYDSVEDSFHDYVDFIQGSARYREALQQPDSAEYFRRLGEAGYATDPEYAEKILRILRSDTLQQAAADPGESIRG